MDLDLFFQNNFVKDDYERYMNKWLGGINNEIWFWDNYFLTRGDCWKSGFTAMTRYERKFTLEEYAEKEHTKVLDVGSGPLSTCGTKTDITNLELTAVDPLACIYKRLKKQYGIKTKIVPQFGMVEKLNELFAANSFDIVHMRNSLDHSFNPLFGIMQLLYVCKIGGQVILVHRDNEAVFEKYKGFHQWNLAVEDGKFMIWRREKIFVVEELFKEYASLRVIPANGKEALHTVIIKKVKEIPMCTDALVSVYNGKVFNKFLEILMDNYLQEKKELTWGDMRVFLKSKADNWINKNLLERCNGSSKIQKE